MSFRSRLFTLVLGAIILTLAAATMAAPPDTVLISGSLRNSAGDPLTGDRVYQITFYDAQTAGNQIGATVSGTVTMTDQGTYNISFVPPAEVLAKGHCWYELGIDTDEPTDGDASDDIFDRRIGIYSVPFALQAKELTGALTDAQIPDDITIDNAANADTLDGMDSTDFATSAALAGKADTDHGHAFSEITGTATDAQIPDDITVNAAATATTATVALSLVGGSGTTTATYAHSAGDANTLDGMDSTDFATSSTLTTELSAKADAADVYTKAQIDSAMAGKSDSGHTHDDRYYTESETDTALAGKSDTSHAHAFSEITGSATDAQVADALTISGGTINNSPIGASTPSSGNFTSLGIEASAGTNYVDAQNTLYNIFNKTADQWQSFTAESTGKFVKAAFMCSAGMDAGNVILTIYEGEGTGGTQIYTGTTSVPDLWNGEWISDEIALADRPTLVQGQQYTIRIQTGTSVPNAAYYNGNPYAGGISSMAADKDFYFKIYMNSTAGGPASLSGGAYGFGTSSPAEVVDIHGPVRLEQQADTPPDTSDRLYNNGGNLYWDGTQLNFSTIVEDMLATTLSFDDGDLLDLSAINASGTGEGLVLPQSTDVSGGVGEGQISWDSDDDKLYVGDGSGVVEIGAGGGGGTSRDTITASLSTLSTGWNTFPVWAQKMKHSGTLVNFQIYAEIVANGTADLQKNGSSVLSAPVAFTNDTVVEATLTDTSFSAGDTYKIIFDNATGDHYPAIFTLIVEY